MSNAYFPRMLDKDLAGPDGGIIASVPSPEDAAAMGFVPDRACAAPVFVSGGCTSTFDTAWRLAENEELPPWSAVLALFQTGGRGQLRREWVSPPGNLYVSFFLPEKAASLETMAALATGYCVHAALLAMGIRTRLKWPNDLLLERRDGNEGKFGGLLLEDRGGRLLAGLGLNLRSAPEDGRLRAGRAVPATALPSYGGSVVTLWLDLVAGMRAVFEREIAGATPEDIRRKTETALAWKGRRVYSGEAGITGELVGIDSEGALLLQTPSGIAVISSGSIAPADAV